MYSIKLIAGSPDCSNKNRFCGEPKGISKDPLMAAMFSMVMTGRMYFSLSPARKRRIVKGTKIIKETSLVTNMEEKNTPKIKNRDRIIMLEKWDVSRMIGRKIFSCLNPSRTISIIKSVPRVCQSIREKMSLLGGVIRKDNSAARTESQSIGSFFKKVKTFFIGIYAKLNSADFIDIVG